MERLQRILLLVLVAARLAAANETPELAKLTAAETRLLDDLERAGCLFFWENGDDATGLVRDRSQADGADARPVASIAATGFGLTALAIADTRGFLPEKDIRGRVRRTLRFLHEKLPEEHGFYFHFVDWRTGEREWKCELSSIDTAILMCGVLTARERFDDAEIRELARKVYERVDWQWMMAGGATLSHGWTPEGGFLKGRWDAYCEHLMLYLLGIGSPTHAIGPEAWHAWKRPRHEYEGIVYIGSEAPLFVHQYSHAWFDFRGRRDAHTDYFENSVLATRAHWRFCVGLKSRFPAFSEDLWGVTASDGPKGYMVWGGPPEIGPLDGSIVPCAAAGSLPFLPKECLRTLQAQRERYGQRIWKRYGFADAFNPQTGWLAADVIGIDVGISVLMAENLQSGFVWKTFGRSEVARKGMERAGFGR